MFIFDPFTWGLLAFLLWAIVFVTVQSRRARRKTDIMKQRFLEEEEAANAVHKRPLEDNLFYTPQPDALPPLPEGDPYKIERAAKRKMIRFAQPMSNVELKKRYGRLQLENLAHYEENYDDYLRALTKWAEALIKEQKTREAAQILEHTTALGAEFRKSYTLLADIYAKDKNKNKLETLLSQAAATTFRDAASAKYVTEYIRERIATLEKI